MRAAVQLGKVRLVTLDHQIRQPAHGQPWHESVKHKRTNNGPCIIGDGSAIHALQGFRIPDLVEVAKRLRAIAGHLLRRQLIKGNGQIGGHGAIFGSEASEIASALLRRLCPVGIHWQAGNDRAPPARVSPACTFFLSSAQQNERRTLRAWDPLPAGAGRR